MNRCIDNALLVLWFHLSKMSNALASIIVGTVLLPRLDKYERPVGNVGGIWNGRL